MMQSGTLTPTALGWIREDLNDIYLVYSDEEGARWVDDGTPITFEECERWMQVTLDNYETRGYGMFTIYDRFSGETVGFCGLVHPGGQKRLAMQPAP